MIRESCGPPALLEVVYVALNATRHRKKLSYSYRCLNGNRVCVASA